MTLTLPDGQRIPLDAVAYKDSGTQITFTFVGGGTITYTDPDADTANIAFLMRKLDEVRAAGKTVLATLPGTAIGITAIEPASFDLATSGLELIVRGWGFDAATAGTLWIEDAGGGLDDNGYSFACTVIDANTLLASFTSVGDAALSADMLIYYRDSATKVSNGLDASNPSGTLITIP